MRIVQFSDTHVLADVTEQHHGVDTFSSLNHAIDVVQSLNPLPDFIFLTGDIAEDGRFASYIRVKNTFERMQATVCAIPGNHDDFAVMTNAFADSRIRLQPYVALNDWVAIFLNSQVSGQSYGSIGPAALSDLEQSLLRAGDRPVIVSLHHPLVSSCPSPSCQINNAHECLELLSRYSNVKVVLAGHLHLEGERQLGHLKLLTTPSTFAGGVHPTTSDSLTEDFWSTHSLDMTQRGFRVVDLLPGGGVESHIVWI